MGRSELTTLLSIGYQGRTSGTLLSMLGEAGVSILVDGRAALDELAAPLSEHRIALLCFELDPANCHRQRASDALLRLEPAARVVELSAQPRRHSPKAAPLAASAWRCA